MIRIEYFTFNPFQERCSVIWDGDGAGVIVDPGYCNDMERDEIYDFVQKNSLSIKAILLTHGHFDHILGAADASRHFNVPVYMHPADKIIIKESNPLICNAFGVQVPEFKGEEEMVIPIAEGDKIPVGQMEFTVIETPGHTPGGVCFFEAGSKILLSGDTLFAGSIGRTDNNWASYDSLMEGIFTKLMVLDGDITVVPGHGPTTSIAQERTTNPFLQPFNEPFEEA